MAFFFSFPIPLNESKTKSQELRSSILSDTHTLTKSTWSVPPESKRRNFFKTSVKVTHNCFLAFLSFANVLSVLNNLHQDFSRDQGVTSDLRLARPTTSWPGSYFRPSRQEKCEDMDVLHSSGLLKVAKCSTSNPAPGTEVWWKFQP